MSRYARRKDLTHNPIAQAFEKLGYSVADTSRLGDDFPDMVIAKGIMTALVEAKAEKGKLRPGQKTFRDGWRGMIFEARSVDDVIEIDRRIQSVRGSIQSYAEVRLPSVPFGAS